MTSHSVSLTELTVGTNRHYRVISEDAVGNQTTSEDCFLRTAGHWESLTTRGWRVAGFAIAAVLGLAICILMARKR